jgi:serine/threonine-protein kinase RsbW
VRDTEEQTVDVKFSLVFPREALSLGVMRRVLGDTLGALGVAPDCVADILLAVTEACTNVLLHGGPSRAYEVMARVGGSRCLLEVVESGARFDPRRNLWAAESWRSAGHRTGLPRRTMPRPVGWLNWHVNKPRNWAADGEADLDPPAGENGPVARLRESGRGLQIMEALVDDVTLRGGVGRGTSVSMQKQLTWRSDAPLAALSGTGLREAG